VLYAAQLLSFSFLQCQIKKSGRRRDDDERNAHTTGKQGKVEIEEKGALLR